jgi:HEAT repeat protein
MLKVLRNRWFWLCLAMVLLGGAVWLWLERSSLQAWYYTCQLARADAEERQTWLARLAYLDLEAVPALLRRLSSTDESSRANCTWALTQLGRRWRTDLPRSLHLVRLLQREFPSLGPVGRGEAMTALAAIGRSGKDDPPMPAAWTEAAGQFVLQSAQERGEASRSGALELAWELVQQERPASEIIGKNYTLACRHLVEEALSDNSGATRALAVRLAALPEMNLLERLAALAYGPKADPNPEVRSLALAAVAAHEEVASTEDLLPLLHDADPEVRATCEHALRGRGLTGAHVQLARQMTDPQPTIRARVPAQVMGFVDLDSRLWLDRLSRDPSPAVRASVLRASAEIGPMQLTERFQVMAQDDPSPTIRQIAAYYLQSR